MYGDDNKVAVVRRTAEPCAVVLLWIYGEIWEKSSCASDNADEYNCGQVRMTFSLFLSSSLFFLLLSSAICSRHFFPSS